VGFEGYRVMHEHLALAFAGGGGHVLADGSGIRWPEHCLASSDHVSEQDAQQALADDWAADGCGALAAEAARGPSAAAAALAAEAAEAETGVRLTAAQAAAAAAAAEQEAGIGGVTRDRLLDGLFDLAGAWSLQGASGHLMTRSAQRREGRRLQRLQRLRRRAAAGDDGAAAGLAAVLAAAEKRRLREFMQELQALFTRAFGQGTGGGHHHSEEGGVTAAAATAKAVRATAVAKAAAEAGEARRAAAARAAAAAAMASASVASVVYLATPQVYRTFTQPAAARRRRRAELCRAAARTAAAGGTVPTLSTMLATGAVDMLVDPLSFARVTKEDGRATPMSWKPRELLAGGALHEARRVQAGNEQARAEAGGIGVKSTHPCRYVTRAERPTTVGGVGPMAHRAPVKNFAVWRKHKASVAVREKCVSKGGVAYVHQIDAVPRPFLMRRDEQAQEGPSAQLGRWTKVSCLSAGQDVWERHPGEERSPAGGMSRTTYLVAK